VSRSGIGAHAWVFFTGPVPAQTARRLGTGLLREAMALRGQMDLASYDRLFGLCRDQGLGLGPCVMTRMCVFIEASLRRSAIMRLAATAESPGTEIREPDVLDPQAVLSQAGQGKAPATWRVFAKERGRVRGFLRGTSADPDPLLVITPDGVAEYTDSRKPAAAVDFDGLSRIMLRVRGCGTGASSMTSMVRASRLRATSNVT
jgi:hypothetical protein